MGMRGLNPAIEQALPCDQWKLWATEAGRYSNGLRASVQVWNGKVQWVQQLALAHPETWETFITAIVQRTGLPSEEVTQVILELANGVEGALRLMAVEGHGLSQATQLVDLAAEADYLDETPCPICASHERWHWLDSRALCRVCLILDLVPMSLARKG